MTIELRLFGTLRAYLPAGHPPPGVQLAMPPAAALADALARLALPPAETAFTVSAAALDASIADALERLAIPPDEFALTFVNGLYERDRTRRLSDGATLSVWSHVAGG